jgi:hypothetical protein
MAMFFGSGSSLLCSRLNGLFSSTLIIYLGCDGTGTIYRVHKLLRNVQDPRQASFVAHDLYRQVLKIIRGVRHFRVVG